VRETVSACERCGSSRILDFSAKCSDLSGGSIGNRGWDGYVPNDLGIGGGDYVEFKLCLDCGQAVGEWPLPESDFEKGSSQL
jgi:hypothetical protein